MSILYFIINNIVSLRQPVVMIHFKYMVFQKSLAIFLKSAFNKGLVSRRYNQCISVWFPSKFKHELHFSWVARKTSKSIFCVICATVSVIRCFSSSIV